MKILSISEKDWSRFQWDNMNALRSVGLNCDSITCQKHEFYNEQSEIVPCIGDMIKRIADYDVIQFFHDNVGLFQMLLPAMKGKKIIAYHTSSYYRANYQQVNAIMNPHVYKCVNAMPEFMSMGAKDAVYMVGAVDTDRIKPVINNNSPLIFAHYPSNPKVKGTDKIIELMSRIDAKFVYSTEIVSYEAQLKRIAECDVYIEMFTEKDGNGQPYGDFGITALEAAAMGKLVITNSRNFKVYYENYGVGFFFCFKSEIDFFYSIKLSNISYNVQTENVRIWIENNHSYKATGNYFLKHILNA